MQLTWETPTLIWIEDAIAERLAERLRTQWEPIYLAQSREEAEALAAAHEMDRLIAVYGNDGHDSSVLAAIPHRAVLGAPEQVKTEDETDVLHGRLPGNVIQWMQSLDKDLERPIARQSLDWDEESVPDQAIAPREKRPTARESRFIEPPERTHRIVASFSTAGGVGKTTTISIMARLLQESGRTVAVVEADEEKAGILRLFGLQPARDGLDTIADFVWSDSEALQAKLEKMAVPISQRGMPDITIYPLIGTLDGLQVSSREIFADFLNHLKKDYEYVLVDLGPRLRDEMTIGTLIAADAVILVYEATEPNLDAAIRHLEIVEQTKLCSKDKYMLLINKVSNHSIKPDLMGRTLELPIIGTLREETDTYHTMANTGRISLPFDSPWRSAMKALLKHVGDEDEMEEETLVPKGGKARAQKTARPIKPRPSAERSFMRKLLGLR